jgi:hypothetical protein
MDESPAVADNVRLFILFTLPRPALAVAAVQRVGIDENLTPAT